MTKKPLNFENILGEAILKKFRGENSKQNIENEG